MILLATLVFNDIRVGAAWTIFLVSYGVFAFGRLPGTKLDRTAMAVIGGVLMFVFRTLTPQQGIRSIDFATIVLLFSMMLLVAGLHLSGFFDLVAETLSRHLDRSHLLPAIIFTSGLLSAFLVNDVVCLFMAPLVLRLSRKFSLRPVPLLLGLATASNIGSSATITGNPQNILIGSLSGIKYLHFLARLGPPALIGLFVDWLIIYWMTRSELKPENIAQPEYERREIVFARAHVSWTVAVTGVVLVGFLVGVAPALAAAFGAALMLLGKHVDRHRIFEEVDWSLLVLFVGLFVVIGGAEQTGITDHLLAIAEHVNLHNPVMLTLSLTGISNIVSNVPAVMLLKNLPGQMADPQRGWLLLSLVSTLAGNLTITGSVANMIVVEKAREDASIGFWEYARVGIPVTIATLMIGVGWLLLT
jgi:Na+/H+ antiporter NhaD/arsenite permease-like protein